MGQKIIDGNLSISGNLAVTGSITQNGKSISSVFEYESKAAFPEEGVIETLYVDKSTNKQYRWDTTLEDYALLSPEESVEVITYDTGIVLTDAQIDKLEHGKLVVKTPISGTNFFVISSLTHTDNLGYYLYGEREYSDANDGTYVPKISKIASYSYAVAKANKELVVYAPSVDEHLLKESYLNFAANDDTLSSTDKRLMRGLNIFRTQKMLANNYDPTSTYTKGNIVIYQNELYKCLNDITVAEAWTASHWAKTDLGALIEANSSSLGGSIGYFELNKAPGGTITATELLQVLKDFCIIKWYTEYYLKAEISGDYIHFIKANSLYELQSTQNYVQLRSNLLTIRVTDRAILTSTGNGGVLFNTARVPEYTERLITSYDNILAQIKDVKQAVGKGYVCPDVVVSGATISNPFAEAFRQYVPITVNGIAYKFSNQDNDLYYYFSVVNGNIKTLIFNDEDDTVTLGSLTPSTSQLEYNPVVPSGTTPTKLEVLKDGNNYYGIPQGAEIIDISTSGMSGTFSVDVYNKISANPQNCIFKILNINYSSGFYSYLDFKGGSDDWIIYGSVSASPIAGQYSLVSYELDINKSNRTWKLYKDKKTNIDTSYLQINTVPTSQASPLRYIKYGNDYYEVDLSSAVKSVNEITPDTNGNVDIVEVERARTLVSKTTEISKTQFKYRTTGGSASLTSGEAQVLQVKGSSIKENGIWKVSNPTVLKSVGFNAFDKATMVLPNYTIDSSGNVISLIGSYVCYVRAPGGVTDGYKVYSSTNSITRIGWSEEIPTSSTTGITVAVDGANVTTLTLRTKLSIIAFEQEGYVCFATTNIDTICVGPQWSGYKNEDFENYSDSSVTLPSQGKLSPSGELVDLPYKTWGYILPGVGDVYDEFDLENGEYINRLGRDDIENIGDYSQLIEGVDYIYDNNFIYYVLSEPVVYYLVNVENTYMADDFGTEEWIDAILPVNCTLAYQANLVDKLRTDVVTISEQNLLDSEKRQVIKNIGAIRTVNSTQPDINGDVAVSHVAMADNLFSATSVNETSTFQFRTTGGEASVGTGRATVKNIYGNIQTDGNIAPTATPTLIEMPRLTITLDEATFKAQVGVEGNYIFIFQSGNWLLNNTTVNLSSYGIELAAGTPISYDSIEFTYHSGSVSYNLNLAHRLDVNVNASTFAEKVGSMALSGTYLFEYDGSVWSLGSTVVTLNEYGIAISGTKVSGDQISVAYTPEVLSYIDIAKPNKLMATGLNQYNPSNVYEGYTIDGTGKVVKQAGSYVGWVKASGMCYSGYVVYSTDSSLTKVGTYTMVPSIVTPDISLSGITFNPFLTTVPIVVNKYIVFATTNPQSVCVHPQWSGYMNEIHSSYTESIINFPIKDLEGNSLPLGVYGIPKVNSVRDQIDLINKKYIKRIGYMEFSRENLEAVKAMGVDYIYGFNCILYVLTTPIEYNIAITSGYEVNDFGTEEFVGSTIGLGTEISYSENLTDKLRTDVLTISPQTLTEAQKLQVLANLGIETAKGTSF